MKLQISPQRWTGLSKADKLKFPQINMAHLEFWAVLGLRGSKWSSSPWRGQGVLEPRVKVICWGTWLLSGTTQTQLSCVKFPLQAAALSIPSWSSQFHADPLDPCKLVLSAFPWVRFDPDRFYPVPLLCTEPGFILVQDWANLVLPMQVLLQCWIDPRFETPQIQDFHKASQAIR